MSVKSESGRSMLEMLMVISVISLLTMGGLMGYQQVIASHSANSIKEDVWVQAQSLKGHNYRGKSIYDSGIGKKTRMGLTMESHDRSSNGSSNDTFSIIVRNVSSHVCRYLSRLDWKDAVRLKIDYEAFPPKNVDCTALNQSGEDTFDLEVLFPKSAENIAGFERTCGNCMSCETCNPSTNACVNNCENKEDICINNGCVPKKSCRLGLNLKNGECEVCDSTLLETCSSCFRAYETRPYWHDSKCVCHGNSCGSGFFCNKDEGNCENCPNYATCTEGTIACNTGYYQIDYTCVECNPIEQESCQLDESTYDDNGCFINKKLTCSGETPVCLDNGACHACPENATCTDGEIIHGNLEDVLLTLNIGNEEHKIFCPLGTYSTDGTTCSDCTTDGNSTCATCPSANPLWNGTSCCASQVTNYLADGSETPNGTICCPTGYTSAVGGTCCKENDSYCKQMNYLQSSGTQYIDTGIIGKTGLSMDTKMSWVSVPGDGTYLGSRTASSVRTYLLHYFTGWTLGYGAYYNQGGGASANTEYTIHSELFQNQQILDVNNTRKMTLTLTDNLNTGLNMYLFGLNQAGGLQYPVSAKCYYLKIYDDLDLKRDFIPVINKDGQAGLYDKVSGKMYKNSGKGKFSAG